MDALAYHKKRHGKIEIAVKMPLHNKHDLSLAYTPGVAAVCKAIAQKKELAYDYTMKHNTIAIVTDGTRVLGLGDIGPEAALPVMEGKAALFKKFGNVDAFPICLHTKDPAEIIATVERIAPVFSGINLEDISSPKCFAIEDALKQQLSIPVFHDDQHGTAIVITAGLIAALCVVGKKNPKIVINGAGAGGMGLVKLLMMGKEHSKYFLPRDLIVCDSKGILSKTRNDLDKYKQWIADNTNKQNKQGTLADALVEADVLVGVSTGQCATSEMIKKMAKKSIVFALANPIPEIWPKDAYAGGAAIVATGRSDFPNQINNVLAFPGVFRGLLDARAKKVNEDVLSHAACALARLMKHPVCKRIIVSPFDKRAMVAVAKAVKEAV